MRYLRTLHIVWSLVIRRVIRRLTRLQTMYNVLQFSKNDEIMSKINLKELQRNRNFCQFNNDQYCKGKSALFYLVSTMTHALVYVCYNNIHYDLRSDVLH